MFSKTPSRKQLRKEKRKQKKARKNEYFSRGKHPKVSVPEEPILNEKPPKKTDKKPEGKAAKTNKEKDPLARFMEERNRDNKKLKDLKRSMAVQHKKQLLVANKEEDRNIKRLEKQLKLNKRKSKGLPKMFVESGLDYILDMCDPEQMKVIAESEKKFMNIEDEFAEDVALNTEKNKSRSKKASNNTKKSKNNENSSDDEDFFDDEEEMSDPNEDGLSGEKLIDGQGKRKRKMMITEKSNKKVRFDETAMNDESDDNDFDEFEEDEDSDMEDVGRDMEDEEMSDMEDEEKSDMEDEEKSDMADEEMSDMEDEENSDLEDEENSDMEDEEKSDIEDEENGDMEDEEENDMECDEESETENNENVPKIKGAAKVNPDGTWEDIYGRLHAKDGSLINKSNQKYIPPAVRAKMDQNNTDDKEALEKLNRLKKQVKGLLNRLAISNMHNIAKQIESLYMSNSRNDMNETLGNLIKESIISVVLTPERLTMEHILLIAILHANIGTEVGAHFLQELVTMFDEVFKSKSEVEDKTLDNIVIALAQMYNFKIFNSKLMHEIMNELSKEFTEKNVNCILHILKNVGFVLRKDDPLALKDFFLESHKKAASVSDNAMNGSRLKYLLDVLTAIKNNNVTKIPNYDDSYSEHLKKLMKNFIRKGNYVTQLNITLEDLLKADEKGKWWVVGSAWTGNSENREKSNKKEKKKKYSDELLEAAKKLRMNTDTRRDIFCVIMSAEHYEDAVEKLMHLGLPKNQEREIMHVILFCCLRENPFNPYYGYLTQKLCETDRKHMLSLKFAIWDKLKAIEKQSANGLSSLSSLLVHLFLNKALPISTLKVIEFAQMDATITRFLRQIFLGILLHNDTETCLNVFKNVAQSDKLKMFRVSLRLFLQMLVRKNLKSNNIDEKQREMLETRSKMAEKLLIIKDTMDL